MITVCLQYLHTVTSKKRKKRVLLGKNLSLFDRRAFEASASVTIWAGSLNFNWMKETLMHLSISVSLAVNRWLSPLADSGPLGANWSNLSPLALLKGVARGQACKGYPLYPFPWTGAQSCGRHPPRIRGSVYPPPPTRPLASHSYGQYEPKS